MIYRNWRGTSSTRKRQTNRILTLRMKRIIFFAVIFLASCASTPTETIVAANGLRPYLTATPSLTPAPDSQIVYADTPLPSPTPFIYEVKQGDTMSEIAERFHISLDALRAANPNISPSTLSIGQKLNIPSAPQTLTEGTPTPAPFTIQQIACHPTLDQGMWCFILARNDFPEFMENIAAQVTLLNASGNVIASEPASLPLNILPPNQSLPLAVFFAPPIPADAAARVQTLTSVRLLSNDARYLPATINNTLVQVDWSGKIARVSGQVALPVESKAATLVWVAAVAYDESNRVVGVRRWESAAGLAGGGSLPFAFNVSSLAGSITRVEFAVEARP